MIQRSIVTLFAGLVSAVASAAILRVAVDPSDAAPFRDVRDAVRAASAGDTILVAAGTYGGPVVLDKPLSLLATDGPFKTTMIGVETASVVRITASASGSVLDGFTFTGGGGFVPPGKRDVYGGGLYTEGDAILRSCVFSHNGNARTVFGGGLCAREAARVRVENCLFYTNKARVCGGAALSEMQTVVEYDHCTIAANVVGRTYELVEGGISVANTGIVHVGNTLLWGNSAHQVGTFLDWPGYGIQSTLIVSNCCAQGGVEGEGVGHFLDLGGHVDAAPVFVEDGVYPFEQAPSSPCCGRGSDGDDIGFLGWPFTQHAVTFRSAGSTLVRRVRTGAAALAPIPAPREGLRFLGWDADCSAVSNDIVANALFEEVAVPRLASIQVGRAAPWTGFAEIDFRLAGLEEGAPYELSFCLSNRVSAAVTPLRALSSEGRDAVGGMLVVTSAVGHVLWNVRRDFEQPPDAAPFTVVGTVRRCPEPPLEPGSYRVMESQNGPADPFRPIAFLQVRDKPFVQTAGWSSARNLRRVKREEGIVMSEK